MGLTNITVNMAAAKDVLAAPRARVFMQTQVADPLAAEVISILPVSDKQHAHAVDNTYGTTRRHGGVECALVVVNVAHARYLHGPTRAHPIDAHNPETTPLKFFWRRYNVTFVGPHVDHPGTPGFPFFEIACRRVGLHYRPGAG